MAERQVALYLDKDTHQKLKQLATLNNVSMSKYVIELIKADAQKYEDQLQYLEKLMKQIK